VGEVVQQLDVLWEAGLPPLVAKVVVALD